MAAAPKWTKISVGNTAFARQYRISEDTGEDEDQGINENGKAFN